MVAFPKALIKKKEFSKKEYIDCFAKCYSMTVPQINYDLKKRIEDGSVIKIGWGKYAIPTSRRVYKYAYSDIVYEIAEILDTEYYSLDFQITELKQLNSFVNHQIAHNTIFVFVEKDYIDYVFDTLWKRYSGRVMLKPKAEDYFRYLQDDEIVVLRLPSQSPKGIEQPWMSRLEKIIVDTYTDKLIEKIVPDSEKSAILETSFHDYAIDLGTMKHYAKRKGAEKEIEKILAAKAMYTSI